MVRRKPLETGFQTPAGAFGEDGLVLRESIEEFPGPVAIFDAEDRVIAHNAEYETLHGTAFETLRREKRTDIFYSDLVSISRHELVPEEEREDYLRSRIAMHHRADGKPFDQFYPGHGWFRYKKVRTPSGAVAAFGTDITELKDKTLELESAMRAAKSANEAKSAFLANMSHELRTPLNAIIGFAETLKIPSIGKLQEGPQTEYLGYIHSAGLHLLSIITQILDIAKVEAGEFQVERRALCLTEIAMDSIAILESAASTKDISIVLTNDIENSRLYGDGNKLTRTVAQILSNAIKFSEPGTIVDIILNESEDWVKIRVIDRGVGIAADMHEAVFKPFGQVETVYSRIQEGTGLGLPIARAIVEAHNGRLSLESAIGEGTTILIDLPRH